MLECASVLNNSCFSKGVEMNVVDGSAVVGVSPAEVVQKAFDFTVDKLPLYGPDNLQTGFYGLFRSDTSEIVGSPVTKKYVPHQTSSVIQLVEAATKAFDGTEDIQCHFNEGHYVTMAPSRAKRFEIFGTKDNIFPRVIIQAGYDGKSYRASLGLYRDMCQNMMIMRAVSEASVSIRHMSGLLPKIDSLVETFHSLGESWEKVTDYALAMEGKTVKISAFLDEIYGAPEKDSGRGATMHKNRTEAIVTRLLNERAYAQRGDIDLVNQEVTLWEAYNAVQGYIQHDASKHGTHTKMSRIVESFNSLQLSKVESVVSRIMSV